jgi:hypothetical protein
MHIQGLPGIFLNRLNHRKSEGQVWHKYTVHNVEMDPVRLTGIHQGNNLLEIAEISCKNGRRYVSWHGNSVIQRTKIGKKVVNVVMVVIVMIVLVVVMGNE